MIEVIVSPEARDDLISIIKDIAANAGLTVADRWDRDIWLAIDGLSDFPKTGSLRPELGHAVRIKIQYPYLIVYENAESGIVQILRVLHGRRLITSKTIRGGS